MKRILRFAAALLALCLPLTGLGEAAPTPVAEIDHYVVQLDDLVYLTEEQIACYHRLMDGIFAQEPQVRLTDDYDSNLNVLGCLRNNPYEFLVEKSEFTRDHRTILLTYAYSPEEQAEMVAYMDGEYLSILREIIEPDMGPLEETLAVYRYFAGRISYDYDYLDDLARSEEKFLYPDIEIYQALKTGRGVCHSYTYLCEFALQQLGVDCLRLRADTEDEDSSHMWLAVRLDGEWYHMDPTWDSDYGCVGLRFFGMTDAERIAGGILDNWNIEVDMSFGEIRCGSERFASLRDVYDFRLIGDHRMEVWREDAEDPEIVDIGSL